MTQKCGTGESTCVLTNFVRDGIWSLEEGIYQMTGKNAQQWYAPPRVSHGDSASVCLMPSICN